MECIGRRLSLQKSFEAKIHGMEIKGLETQNIEVPKFTEEESKLLDQELEDMLARKRGEARGRHPNQNFG